MYEINASRNMVAKANDINERLRLFAPERFKIVQGNQFDLQMIPSSFPKSQNVMLFLSFVLAPETYKADNVRKLAEDWKEYIENQLECRQTKIIYLNPLNTSFHRNWDAFKQTMLTPNATGKFCYTADEYIRLPVDGLPNPVYCAMIHGIPK